MCTTDCGGGACVPIVSGSKEMMEAWRSGDLAGVGETLDKWPEFITGRLQNARSTSGRTAWNDVGAHSTSPDEKVAAALREAGAR